jgi:hypothetical protein
MVRFRQAYLLAIVLAKNQLLDIFTKINEPGAQVIKAMITLAE